MSFSAPAQTSAHRRKQTAALCAYAVACALTTVVWLGYMGWQIHGKTPTLIVSAEGKLVRLSDFIAFYSAGKVAAEHGDIYDTALQKASLDKYIAPYATAKDLFIPYPPPFFVFLLPFTLLSSAVAWIVWNLLGALTGSIAMFAATRDEIGRQLTQLLPVLALVASYPFELSISLGQTTLFMMAALTIMWLLLKKGRMRLAGLMAGLGVMKLHYVPGLFIAGTIFGGSGFAISFFAANFLSWLLSAAIFGASNVVGWLKTFGVDERKDIIVDITAWQNVRAQLHLWFGDHHWIVIVSWLVFALSLLAIAWLWLRLFPLMKQSSHRVFELMASLTTLLSVTFNPHCFPQDYVVAALPCFWLYLWARDNADRIGLRLRNAIYSCVILFPLLGWLFAALHNQALQAHVELFFWWGIAVETLAVVAVSRVLRVSRLQAH